MRIFLENLDWTEITCCILIFIQYNGLKHNLKHCSHLCIVVKCSSASIFKEFEDKLHADNRQIIVTFRVVPIDPNPDSE